MQHFLQITFRGMKRSPALEAHARDLALSLERFNTRIARCEVTVGVPHRHQSQGRVVEVQVRLVVEQSGVAGNQDHVAAKSHEDGNLALRDAFRAMRRQLQHPERRQRRASGCDAGQRMMIPGAPPDG